MSAAREALVVTPTPRPRDGNAEARRQALTLERLYELLGYDPETGVFTWLVDRYSYKGAGQIAGWVHKSGYRYISIDCRMYRASRVAWLYVHGVWPPDQIDHINRRRDDDRIANLRLASNSQNMANRRKNGDSASPYKGVLFKKSKNWWIARVQVNGRRIERSGFQSAESAWAARNELAARLHGEYARAE